jgi:predicted aldo/keto reductase-like oxidoreductase
MEDFKRQGMIRHIDITCHKIGVAEECAESGLYETLQFPLSYLSGEQELNLVKRCQEQNMGFIAMKALAGGLINKSAAAFAWMSQFDNVLPIWGIQRMTELEEFLAFFENPAEMKGELLEIIEKDRRELAGDFCRGCGYCLPCPAGIKIYDCARMSLMIRRAPTKNWISEEWQAEMAKIENCIHCGKCHTKCPYGLNAAEILAKNYEDYKKIISGEIKV